MIKVYYDTETTLVKGYYPDSINYASIPEPNIEITDEQHQEALSKTMCVVNGVFQEYVKSDSLLLEELRTQKIAQCKAYLASTDWQIIRLSDPSSGESLKEGVVEKRALARSIQNDIETEVINTLEDLNNINFE